MVRLMTRVRRARGERLPPISPAELVVWHHTTNGALPRRLKVSSLRELAPAS